MKVLKLYLYALVILLQVILSRSVSVSVDALKTNHNWEKSHARKDELETHWELNGGYKMDFQEFTSSGSRLIGVGSDKTKGDEFTFVEFNLESGITVVPDQYSFCGDFANAKEKAEIHADTKWYKPLLKFDDQQFLSGNFRSVSIHSIHDFPNVNAGFTDYKKKFGVIFKYGGTDFRFAICVITRTFVDGKGSDIPPPDKFLVLGFSQKYEKPEGLEDALEQEYFTHSDAFGRIVFLPSFYSGKEREAKEFFRVQKSLQNIGRRLAEDFFVTGNIEVLRAWLIPKNGHAYKVGVYKITAGEGGKVLFFFVACSASNATELSDPNSVIGPLHVDEFSTTQNIVDYVKGYHTTNLIYGEDYVVVKSKENQIHPVDILTTVTDIASRACTFKDRGDTDKTPFINKGIAVLKLLVEQHGIEDLPTLVAAILCELPVKNIDKRFGTEVQKIVEQRNGTTVDHVENPSRDLSEQDEKKMKQFEDSTQTFAFEGWAKYDNLETIWAARNKKITHSEKVIYAAKFTINYVSSFNLGKKNYGIFKLTQHYTSEEKENIEQKNAKIKLTQDNADKSPNKPMTNPLAKNEKPMVETYHFVIECIAGDVGNNYDAVVGELRENTPEVIKKQMIEDYNEAKLFHDIYTGVYGLEAEERKVAPAQIGKSEIAEFIIALHLAANRHFAFHSRRTGYNIPPYINHLIGVTKIANQLRNITDVHFKMAGLLHDSVEDTITTAEEIEEKIHLRTANIVVDVSDKQYSPTGESIDVTDKKAAQNARAKIHKVEPATLKVADRIYNLRDFSTECGISYGQDRRFWYFSESRKLFNSYAENRQNRKQWNKKTNDKFTKSFDSLMPILDELINAQTHPLLPEEKQNQEGTQAHV